MTRFIAIGYQIQEMLFRANIYTMVIAVVFLAKVSQENYKKLYRLIVHYYGRLKNAKNAKTTIKKLKMTLNLEEKFTHDFDSRFGGRAIISDDSTVPFSTKNQTCSKREIIAWIDQWISENGDLTNDFKLNTNAFLKIQFGKEGL